MSNLEEKIDAGEFVLTCETGPPKGVETEDHLQKLDEISDFIDAFNVTDQQSSVMKLGSLVFAHLIQKRGYEAVYQLTCRDRNRLALQSDLMNAWVLGLENVLALTGDDPSIGDHPDAKPVFDLHSPQLLEAINYLNSGKDMAGNEIEGNTDFFQGAAVNPGADPLEPQIKKTIKKVERGAKFFQSQAVYDPEHLENFIGELREAGVKEPVLAGVIPLKSVDMARYMNENIPGITIPENVIHELKGASNTVEKSLEICARVIRETSDLCEGVHLMPMGWESHVPKILEKAGIKRKECKA